MDETFEGSAIPLVAGVSVVERLLGRSFAAGSRPVVPLGARPLVVPPVAAPADAPRHFATVVNSFAGYFNKVLRVRDAMPAPARKGGASRGSPPLRPDATAATPARVSVAGASGLAAEDEGPGLRLAGVRESRAPRFRSAAAEARVLVRRAAELEPIVHSVLAIQCVFFAHLVGRFVEFFAPEEVRARKSRWGGEVEFVVGWLSGREGQRSGVYDPVASTLAAVFVPGVGDSRAGGVWVRRWRGWVRVAREPGGGSASPLWRGTGTPPRHVQSPATPSASRVARPRRPFPRRHRRGARAVLADSA